ncbi:MAG: hypothetical protein CEE38_00820 [Planctomycetes bacterium B3_Pla]|nr:MAG: hypothetical protein CEE38_00820 [Planctomycetes bacterium B3_Pla]
MYDNHGLTSAIPYVVFSVTTRCNLSCPGCFRIGHGQVDVQFDKFRKCLDILADASCRYLNITGGEPTLHPHWRRLISVTEHVGIRPLLSTNGTMLDSLENPALQRLAVLSIPLDGASEATNDKIRGEGHFTHIQELIREYRRGSFPFVLKVNTMVAEENIDELHGVLRMIDAPGIVWKLFQFSPRGEFSSQRVTKLSPVSCRMFSLFVEQIRCLPVTACRIASLGSADTGEYVLIDPEARVLIPRHESYHVIGNLLSGDTTIAALIVKASPNVFALPKSLAFLIDDRSKSERVKN